MTGSASSLLKVDYQSLAQVASSLRSIGSDIIGSDNAVGATLDNITYGSGDFNPMVEYGATAFALAWREIIEVCGESLGNICTNMGNCTLDLRATDLNDSPYSTT